MKTRRRFLGTVGARAGAGPLIGRAPVVGAAPRGKEVAIRDVRIVRVRGGGRQALCVEITRREEVTWE